MSTRPTPTRKRIQPTANLQIVIGKKKITANVASAKLLLGSTSDLSISNFSDEMVNAIANRVLEMLNKQPVRTKSLPRKKK